MAWFRKNKKSEDDPAWKPKAWWKRLLKGFLWFILIDVILFLLATGWLKVSNPFKKAKLEQAWSETIGPVTREELKAEWKPAGPNAKDNALIEALLPFEIEISPASDKELLNWENFPWFSFVDQGGIQYWLEDGFKTPQPTSSQKEFFSSNKSNIESLLNVADLPGPFSFGKWPRIFNLEPGTSFSNSFNSQQLSAVDSLLATLYVAAGSEEPGMQPRILEFWRQFNEGLFAHQDFFTNNSGLQSTSNYHRVYRSLGVHPPYLGFAGNQQALKDAFFFSVRMNVLAGLNNKPLIFSFNEKNRERWSFWSTGFPGKHWTKRRVLNWNEKDLELMGRFRDDFVCGHQLAALKNEADLRVFLATRRNPLVPSGNTAHSWIQMYQVSLIFFYDQEMTLAIIETRQKLLNPDNQLPRTQAALDDFVLAKGLPLKLSCPDIKITYTRSYYGVVMELEGPGLNPSFPTIRRPSLQYTIQFPQNAVQAPTP